MSYTKLRVPYAEVSRDARLGTVERIGSIMARYGNEMCIGGGKSEPGLSPKRIGAGVFGNAYIIKLTDLSFVIKEAIAEAAIFNEFQKKGTIPPEIYLNKMLGQLVADGVTQHFPMIAGAKLCGDCEVEANLGGGKKKQFKHKKCYSFAMELFSGNLGELIDTAIGGVPIGDDMFANIIFQVLHALACAQSRYGFHHGDMKLDNLLFRFLKPGGYWEYRMGDETYFLKNRGILVVVSDVGTNSLFLRPSLSRNGFYGGRNFKVANGVATRFHTKFTSIESGKKSHSLVPSSKGFFSHFRHGFDLKPEIPVDLEDTEKFPAREFREDMFKFLNIMMGVDPGTGLFSRVDTETDKPFYKHVKNTVYKEFPTGKPPARPGDSAPAFSFHAKEMLRTLFASKKFMYTARPRDEPLLAVFAL